MITPILILHGKLTAAIALKQMLERLPRCEVHPFTTPDAAVDYAREHPQDAALVDLASLGAVVAVGAIRALRTTHPAMLIVVMPSPGDEHLERLGADAALPIDFRAHDFGRLIDGWHKRRTMTAPAITPQIPDPASAYTDAGSPEAARSGLLQHIFDDDTPPPPDTLPEQPATLESVLQQMGHDDFGYQQDDDGPGEGARSDSQSVFDEAATPSDPQSSVPMPDAPRPTRSDFDALVESLRRDPPPIGSRMADFIIRGGAEMVFGADDAPPPSPLRPERPTRRYSDDSLRTYRQLAHDEPPVPGFADGGTISDMMGGMHDKGFAKVLAILRGDSVEESSEILARPGSGAAPYELSAPPMTIDLPRPASSFDGDPVPPSGEVESPARIILEQTLEQSMEEGHFSIEELLDSLEERLPNARIKPFSPHIQQQAQERWRAAQAALTLIEDEADSPPDIPEHLYADQTTRASQAQRYEVDPGSMETDWIDAPVIGIDATRAIRAVISDTPPPASLPETVSSPSEDEEAPVFFPDTMPEPTPDSAYAVIEVPALEIGADETWGEWYTEDFNTQFELMAAFDLPVERRAAPPAAPVPEPPPDVPELPPVDRTAQTALALTHAALETTAEAALLLRDGQIAASAGRMAADELLALQPTILAAHRTDRRDARVQFVTQAESGRDYLLYSCQTEAGTLTLIFRGTTSMSDIRRQGARLVEALQAVPERPPIQVPTPPPAAPIVETTAREPFAYVWLLRDREAYLDEPAARAIDAGLHTQLREMGWRVRTLQVSGEYVYLLADVPGEQPAFRVVRDLKARSAAIVHALNPTLDTAALWADSYLIVTPGRALDFEEIQQFINFERM